MKFIIEGEITNFGNTKRGMKEALRFRLMTVVRDATQVKIRKITLVEKERHRTFESFYREKHDCGNQCPEHQDHSWLK